MSTSTSSASAAAARTPTEQLHHDEVWNAIALCSLFAAIGLTTSGALVAAIFQHPGRSLEITLGFLAVVVAVAFVALIAYMLGNPLYETKQEAARAKGGQSRPRR